MDAEGEPGTAQRLSTHESGTSAPLSLFPQECDDY